jgi:hypothetical protein
VGPGLALAHTPSATAALSPAHHTRQKHGRWWQPERERERERGSTHCPQPMTRRPAAGSGAWARTCREASPSISSPDYEYYRSPSMLSIERSDGNKDTHRERQGSARGDRDRGATDRGTGRQGQPQGRDSQRVRDRGQPEARDSQRNRDRGQPEEQRQGTATGPGGQGTGSHRGQPQ